MGLAERGGPRESGIAQAVSHGFAHYPRSFSAMRIRWNHSVRLGLPLGVACFGGLGLHLAQAVPAPAAPAGDFDWCVPPGQTFVLNTDFTQVVGGPHCTPTAITNVVGGVLELRNLWIQEGATVRVEGTAPLLIQASGAVRIDGTLDASGHSSPGVTTLNTANIPEPGATGVAGGGKGGTGSPLTTQSSPQGGNGFGAFDSADLGGGGGETGWSNLSQQLDSRRGAGGGGGALGANQAQAGDPALGDWNQSFIGLDIESGFSNKSPEAQGAFTGIAGPFGGRAGNQPFDDGDPSNDFYGIALDANGNATLGELDQPWAGAGGGGGGDASFVAAGGTFPNVPFNPNADEKGGSGGGGGGSVTILAAGDIVFGSHGRILARGGSGGGGENTSFLNRVGGAGGGGSGGHVILQTLGVIDMRQSVGPSTSAASLGSMLGGILATGGQGGAGKGDVGGAILGQNGKTDTLPHQDACPPTLSGNAYPTTGPNACRGHIDGAGGDGGPGIVQMHTRTGLDPVAPSILLPPGVEIGFLVVPAPVCSELGCRLVPDVL
jgi:hypothetical protein